jgi:hypothetical protein
MPIRFSSHAVDRFQERVRPTLDEVSALRELRRLVHHGTIATEPPGWLQATARQRAPLYLVIGDLVLPLDISRRSNDQLIALTVIPRGSLSTNARALRNARRARRRQHYFSPKARRDSKGERRRGGGRR